MFRNVSSLHRMFDGNENNKLRLQLYTYPTSSFPDVSVITIHDYATYWESKGIQLSIHSFNVCHTYLNFWTAFSLFLDNCVKHLFFCLRINDKIHVAIYIYQQKICIKWHIFYKFIWITSSTDFGQALETVSWYCQKMRQRFNLTDPSICTFFISIFAYFHYKRVCHRIFIKTNYIQFVAPIYDWSLVLIQWTPADPN